MRGFLDSFSAFLRVSEVMREMGFFNLTKDVDMPQEPLFRSEMENRWETLLSKEKNLYLIIKIDLIIR